VDEELELARRKRCDDVIKTIAFLDLAVDRGGADLSLGLSISAGSPENANTNGAL
jgi:hypothetical protein